MAEKDKTKPAPAEKKPMLKPDPKLESTVFRNLVSLIKSEPKKPKK